jgi:hypothetical protein
MVMVRARIAGVALAAALGLACGCSTPSGCSSCSGTSFTSRLTGLFRRDRTPTEVVGSPIEGPVIGEPGPGCCDGSGGLPPQSFAPPPSFAPAPQPFAPPPQSFAPPLAPPPRELEAQRMPYQP